MLYAQFHRPNRRVFKAIIYVYCTYSIAIVIGYTHTILYIYRNQVEEYSKEI